MHLMYWFTLVVFCLNIVLCSFTVRLAIYEGWLIDTRYTLVM